jgi:hypothetical protein
MPKRLKELTTRDNLVRTDIVSSGNLFVARRRSWLTMSKVSPSEDKACLNERAILRLLDHDVSKNSAVLRMKKLRPFLGD